MKKIKLLTSLTSLASLTAITLPLTSCSCSNSNNPTVHTVESVEVVSEPTTTTFKVSETFNAKGLVLKYKEDDGSRWLTDRDFTTDYDDYTFTSTDIGEHTVTVTYKNKTCTYKIKVESTVAKSIVLKPIEGTYFTVDDAGDPRFTDTIESGKTYNIIIEYDKDQPFVFSDERCLQCFDENWQPQCIFSYTSGEYSATTTASSSITISPYDDPGVPENAAYQISFDENTTQTITITFKAILSVSNVGFGFTGN